MKTYLHIFFLIALGSIFYSCKQNAKEAITDEHIYEMGWQIFENNYFGNLELAEKKFDSLLILGSNLHHNFIIDGLDTKNELGKLSEVTQILSGLNNETLSEICHVTFLNELKECSCCLEKEASNKELELELAKMYINDQAVRGKVHYDLIKKYGIDSSEVIRTGMGKVDLSNRERIKQIISEYGFPNKRQVGSMGMKSIFIIIQHADRDPEWQKAQLGDIKIAVDKGELEAQKYAYLFDRIRVNSGEKQYYGTQFADVDVSKGTAIIAETEDLEGLYKRRMEIGLMPLKLYKKLILTVGS